MTSKSLQALMSIHNPMHKPPTYEELGIPKPNRKHRKKDHAPFPVRYILCAKCKNPGGTLIRIDGKYFHTDCIGNQSP